MPTFRRWWGLWRRHAARRGLVSEVNVFLQEFAGASGVTIQSETYELAVVAVQDATHIPGCWSGTAVAVEVVVQLGDKALQPGGVAGGNQRLVKLGMVALPALLVGVALGGAAQAVGGGQELRFPLGVTECNSPLQGGAFQLLA